MAKLKKIYICSSCGFNTPKWLGQCPECLSWSTLNEDVINVAPESKAQKRSLTNFSSEITPLAQAKTLNEERITTNISELDRLLGGGLIAGQLVLLAGEPGIGKSTLMLQTADKISAGKKVLYVSGEESLEQIGSRAQRLKVKSDNILLLSETDLGKITDAVNSVNPDVLIIDSIQTMVHPEYNGSAGTVSQIRESASELLRICKPKGKILFMLGHVTKDGDLAGPKVLEHVVDTVLYFENERSNLFRMLRAHKNRFGPTNELGIFEMDEKGLTPVTNASMFFSEANASQPAIGRAFSLAVEGTRPLLIEVQALATISRFPYPKRVVTGLDLNRCELLFASIEKHLGVSLDSRDIFVSLAGGIKIKDPALDLAVCTAIISSVRDIAISNRQVFIGETSILGRVSRVPNMASRLNEAGRIGFETAVCPVLNDKDELKNKHINAHQISDIRGLYDYILNLPKQ